MVVPQVMTMATYYNMANSSRHASIGPLESWTDVRQLWGQWLLVRWPNGGALQP